MKRRDLVRRILACGSELLREGGEHSIYYNPHSRRTFAVPRHAEVNEMLSKKILAQACE